MDNFVAFDFETASGKNPCSIGAVEYMGGQVVDKFYSLINPEIEKFNPFTINIHGIRPSDVIDERNFGEIWDDLKNFIKGKVLVAHNLPFDLSVLNYSMNRYGIYESIEESYCTLKLSRKFLDLPNYKLSTVASYYSFRQENHHNALEDAMICGQVFLKLLEYSGKFENQTTSNKKAYNQNNHKISSVDHYEFRKLIDRSLSEASEAFVSKRIVISGIFSFITREELKMIIERHGGKVSSSISSKTSFLVAGDKMGPSKLAKAESLGVTMISEQEFLNMI